MESPTYDTVRLESLTYAPPLDNRKAGIYTNVYFPRCPVSQPRATAMLNHAPDNLRRLMAFGDLTVEQVVAATRLDRRTILGILDGSHKPQPRTLHRLAEGLGVAVDELFLDPAQLLYRQFDRQTNPAVEEVLDRHPDVFSGWTEADFDELHSRVGSGGPLTTDGALAAARTMNENREAHDQLSLLLESSQAGLVRSLLRLLYENAAVSTAAGPESKTEDRRQKADRHGPRLARL